MGEQLPGGFWTDDLVPGLEDPPTDNEWIYGRLVQQRAPLPHWTARFRDLMVGLTLVVVVVSVAGLALGWVLG